MLPSSTPDHQKHVLTLTFGVSTLYAERDTTKAWCPGMPFLYSCSVVIVIHVPEEHSPTSVQEIWELATQPAFILEFCLKFCLLIRNGAFVTNASLFGHGNGTAKGGSPHACVAANKVMEFGMNFLAGDDMSAVLQTTLRKSIGFGMTTNKHITGITPTLGHDKKNRSFYTAVPSFTALVIAGMGFFTDAVLHLTGN
ncbi:C2 domain-containing protein [Carex littledalei]|uniref:C2 domain-containing protein n=1 Tax=Carex littledalei TaxID=544730 RepID=A0A833QSR7_9POAL|nr:C2 domain-containing protein [Carex littledalei]